MNRTEKVAANLRAFQMGVYAHDRENPEPHPAAYGIGMAQFDMDRLGFDEGETILPGITVHADGKGTGNFRVLCGGEHDEPEAETTRAVSRDTVPVGGPGPSSLRALTGRQTSHPVTGVPVAGDHCYVLWDVDRGRTWTAR